LARRYCGKLAATRGWPRAEGLVPILQAPRTATPRSPVCRRRGSREQAVEIALGPNGAFENGSIGTVTRRVPADRVVCAVPPRRGKPEPRREPATPRVVELLRKAIEWQALLESGKARNQAEIARQECVTRARVTQIMGMSRLAPEIQGYIWAMPDVIGRPVISERALRPISQIEDRQKQALEFFALLGPRA